MPIQPMGAGPVGPAWTPMEALGFGWNVLAKRYGAVALPLVVAMLVYVLPSYILNYGGIFTISLLQSSGAIDNTLAPFATLAAAGLGGVIGLVLFSYVAGGATTVCLRSLRGQPTTVGDVFGGGRYFVRFLVAAILFSIPYVIGFALCIVPGLLFLSCFCLFALAIVDQDLSGVDALKKSWEMTEGHRMNLVIFFVISFFVYLAGVLACGIGALLVSMPTIVIALSWIYLRIKGEPVVEPT